MRRLLFAVLVLLPIACGGGGTLTSDSSEDTDRSEHTPSGDNSEAIHTLNLPGVKENRLLPVTLGNRWEYDVEMPGAGRVTLSQTITAAERTGRDSSTVTMHTETDFEDDKYPDTDTELGYIFHTNGSLEVPPGPGPTLFGLETETSGTQGNLLWPSRAELESGQPHSGQYEVDISGIKATTKFTVRGTGKEDVSVPAGTFAGCQVMTTELQIETLGTTSTSTVTYWFAADVGWVKYTYVNDLSGTMTGELVEYDVG